VQDGLPYRRASLSRAGAHREELVRRRLNRAVRKVRGLTTAAPARRGEAHLSQESVRSRRLDRKRDAMYAASDCKIDMKSGDIFMDVLYEGRLLRQLDVYGYPFEVHYNERAEEDPWVAQERLSRV
jgi:hypothetical protein